MGAFRQRRGPPALVRAGLGRLPQCEYRTVGQKIDGPDATRAVEDLQHNPFEGAKRAVEVAKILLAGEEGLPAGVPAPEALQATREPSSDTVQKPAGE